MMKNHLDQKYIHPKRLEHIISMGSIAPKILHDLSNLLQPLFWAEGGNFKRNLSKLQDFLRNIQTFCEISRKISKPRPIDLVLVVDEVLKCLRNIAQKRPRIVESNHSKEAWIMATPEDIWRLFINIYCHVLDIFESKHGTIYFTLKSGQNFVKLVIEAHSDTCNEKFISNGSGVTLALIQNIVENYGGGIVVNATEGKTLHLSILFPLCSPHNKDSTMKSEIADYVSLMGKQERILLMNSNQNILKVEADILRDEGFEVLAFTSKEKALQEFMTKPESFQQIILHEKDLAKEFRKISSNISIIITTSLLEILQEDRLDEETREIVLQNKKYVQTQTRLAMDGPGG